MTDERFTFDKDVNDDRMYEMGVFSDNGEIMETTDILNYLNNLHKENERLKQLLDYADDLIQSHLSEHFIRQWRNFKTGHKEYNDFWEEKLKKHKELKEGME